MSADLGQADALADCYALTSAELNGDGEGERVILDNCPDLRRVCMLLAEHLARALTVLSGPLAGGNPHELLARMRAEMIGGGP